MFSNALKSYPSYAKVDEELKTFQHQQSWKCLKLMLYFCNTFDVKQLNYFVLMCSGQARSKRPMMPVPKTTRKVNTGCHNGCLYAKHFPKLKSSWRIMVV